MLKNIFLKTLHSNLPISRLPSFRFIKPRVLTTFPFRPFVINTAPKHELELTNLLEKAQEQVLAHKYSEAIKTYEECLSFIETQSNKKDYANLFINYLLSKAYYQNKEYTKAIHKAEQIIKVPDEELNTSNLQYVSDSYSIIAHSYLELNDLQKSEEFVRQCIKFKRMTSEHVLTLISYYKFLANLYIKQKKYPEALKILEDYLSEFSSTPPAFAETFAELYYIMGGIYENMKKLDKAILIYQNALKQGLFKQKPEEQTLVESKIALLYVETKNKEKAIETATKVLEKLNQVADKEISRVTLNNCIKVLDDLQENPLVLNLLKSWIESSKTDTVISNEIIRKVISMVDEKYEYNEVKQIITGLKDTFSKRETPSNIDMAELISYLAKLEKKNSNLDDALKLYLEAINLIKMTKKIPQSVPSILIEMAEIYFKKKNFDSALDSMYESLGVLSKFFGRSHPEAISIFTQSGNILKALGGKNEARDYYEKALLYAIDTLGQGHKITGFSYLNFGNALILTDLTKDGSEFIQNGLKILQKEIDRESREYCNALALAIEGFCYARNYNEAIKLGKDRLRLVKTLFGDLNMEYLNSLLELGSICTEANQVDDGLNYLQDALKVSKGLGENSPEMMKRLNIEIQKAINKKKAMA